MNTSLVVSYSPEKQENLANMKVMTSIFDVVILNISILKNPLHPGKITEMLYFILNTKITLFSLRLSNSQLVRIRTRK